MTTPGFIKAISRSETSREAAAASIAALIKLVRWTGSWRFIGMDIPESFWRDGKPFIVCFWHGRLMMMPLTWTHTAPFHMLISDHADGKLIARTVNRLGIETLGGSTRRGGSQALRSMLKILKSQGYVGITPDGPRGPRMRASPGAVALSRLSGAPIIPLAFSTSRRLSLASWDRFHLALPFSRGVFVWGDPIQVPESADEEDMETYRKKLEHALNRATDEADRLTGQDRIEPAPDVQWRAQAGAAL